MHIESFQEKHRRDAEDILKHHFEPHMKGAVDYINAVTDWKNSFVAVDDNKVMGVYALGDSQLKDVGVQHPDYDNLHGIQGIALGVHPNVRGMGVGKALKDHVDKHIKRDYIFGMQLKGLNNIEHWTKTRKIVAESPNMYITAKHLPSGILKHKILNKFKNT